MNNQVSDPVPRFSNESLLGHVSGLQHWAQRYPNHGTFLVDYAKKTRSHRHRCGFTPTAGLSLPLGALGQSGSTLQLTLQLQKQNMTRQA